MPEDIHTIQSEAEDGGRLTFYLYGVARIGNRGKWPTI